MPRKSSSRPTRGCAAWVERAGCQRRRQSAGRVCAVRAQCTPRLRLPGGTGAGPTLRRGTAAGRGGATLSRRGGAVPGAGLRAAARCTLNRARPAPPCQRQWERWVVMDVMDKINVDLGTRTESEHACLFQNTHTVRQRIVYSYRLSEIRRPHRRRRLRRVDEHGGGPRADPARPNDTAPAAPALYKNNAPLVHAC